MDYGALSDEDLALRFHAGHMSAFEALLDRHSRSIYNFSLRMLGDPADAEDATQQTLIQAFETLPTARPGASLRPWFFQVARNKCIDMMRKRRTIPLSSLERDDSDTPALDPSDTAPLPSRNLRARRAANAPRRGDRRAAGSLQRGRAHAVRRRDDVRGDRPFARHPGEHGEDAVSTCEDDPAGLSAQASLKPAGSPGRDIVRCPLSFE